MQVGSRPGGASLDVLEARVVQLAPRSFDFIRHAAEAEWSCDGTPIEFGACAGRDPQGATMRGTQRVVSARDRRYLGPALLASLGPVGRGERLRGRYSGVVVPEAGAVVRASFTHTNASGGTPGDVRVTLYSHAQGVRRRIVEGAALARVAGEGYGHTEEGPELCFESVLPVQCAAQVMDFELELRSLAARSVRIAVLEFALTSA